MGAGLGFARLIRIELDLLVAGLLSEIECRCTLVQNMLDLPLCSCENTTTLLTVLFRLLLRLLFQLFLSVRCLFVAGRSFPKNPSTTNTATTAFLHISGAKRIEVVVVCQLLTSHDTSIAIGKERHPWLTVDGPFLHSTIWSTRVIDKARNASSHSSIND